MSLSPHLVPLFASLAVAFCGSLSAQDWASEERPLDLSEELPSGADPGGAAFKGKILRLTKTSGGLRDGRLVVVYADANHDEIVWAPRSLDHLPRDVFARTSDDEGKTWSDPVNLSNSAGSFSASTDWDGDGVDETYWGDCSKANVFSVGDSVVVSWVSKYAPEPGWTFGTSGASSLQGTISYPDLDVYPNTRVVPYAAVWCAISNDGGTTWAYGDVATQNPPLQLSYGNRDAIQDVHRGTSGRWVMTWQEDPEGLQPGDAEGPGLGASGAKGSKGTDVWYTYTADIVNDPLAILANRTPLTNHSTYDATQVHFPLVGQAGTVENHASTRANLFLMKDGAIFRALVAYEETKGIQDVLEGKTVNYHSFPFDQPVQNGPDTARSGAPGTTLTDLLENSRRVRFVAQPPSGVDPAICIFWKQGLEAQGAPSDILLKTSLTLDEAAVDAAPILNVSANTPAATPLDLANPTMLDPFEDARAHRAYMRGSFVMVGFTYTPNQALARYTNLENYDFWVRRSFDGGATWAAPRNLSNLPKDLACREPRVVGPAKTGTQDDGAILV
ncbi:MAG: choice-of-anchor O protein, partial [Planctomycetota bacterium JB042]